MSYKSRSNWYFGDSESKCDRCIHQNTKMCDDCRSWNKFKEKKETWGSNLKKFILGIMHHSF